MKIRTAENEKYQRHVTWLELFQDLGYVLAVASLSDIFNEGITAESFGTYCLFFFLIFWSWNRFSWLSTYYDDDSWAFKSVYLFSVLPVLGLAYSVELALSGNFSYTALCYFAINFSYFLLWGRVYRNVSDHRRHAKVNFFGHGVSTVVLGLSLFLSKELFIYIVCLVACIELVTPYLSWKTNEAGLPINTGHIAERYGLFAIILLGEGFLSLLGNFNLSRTNQWYLIVLSYLILVCVWQIYFDHRFERREDLYGKMSRALIFSYGHFFIFLSLALICVGMELDLHEVLHSGHGPNPDPGLLSASVGTFLIALSLVQTALGEKHEKGIFVARIIGGSCLVVSCVYLSLPTEVLIAITAGTLALLVFIQLYLQSPADH